MPRFFSKLLKRWKIRLLTIDFIDEIQSFIGLFNDFFQLCEGEKGSAIGILTSCPPSKNLTNDKFVLGIYDKDILIGLLDIIRDYPEKNIWTIGYLLIHPNYRNQGIGGRFIEDLHESLKPIKLRCVVQQQNESALTFWKSNGFLIVNQVEDKSGILTNTVSILEKQSEEN